MRPSGKVGTECLCLDYRSWSCECFPLDMSQDNGSSCIQVPLRRRQDPSVSVNLRAIGVVNLQSDFDEQTTADRQRHRSRLLQWHDGLFPQDHQE